MQLRAATAGALARGQALFNAGRFWEAHESWEAAWKAETGEPRLMLHGLIQVAAGCHHVVVTGHHHASVKLLTSGLDRLRSVPDGLGGLALSRFLGDAARTLQAAQEWEHGERAAVDPALLPQLHWL